MANIHSTTLWETIKKRRAEMQRYNISKWEPESFDSYSYLQVNYLDKDWLSDSISTEDLRSMRPNMPMLIAAQTGCGKSTLLWKKLLSICIQENRRVLYLCSRTALAIKTKEDAMRDLVNGEAFCGKKRVKEFSKFLTPEGLKERINFGYADITTYQYFINNSDDFHVEDYSFIFGDEIHMISSDAGYVVQTYEILTTLVNKFRNTRRIYVTATPDECIEHIREEETRNNYKLVLPRDRVVLSAYVMQENYEYLNPHFFNTQAELISIINKNIDKLWLIFVEDKKVGEKLKEDLSTEDFEPLFITAETDKASDEFQKLIKNEKMPRKIIISTSVLNVGINLKNYDIYVAIASNQIVEVKQYLGRKRLNDVSERVNAYFKVPSNKELSNRKSNINKRIGEINQTLYKINNNEFIDVVAAPFGVKGKEVFYNPLCMHKLKSELRHLDKIIAHLSPYDDPDERSIAYAEFLLSNFEGVQYTEDDLLVEPQSIKLKKLLMPYMEKTFGKEDFAKFAEEFKELMGDTRAHPRNNNPGISSIKECLQKHGFAVESIGSPVQYRIVEVGDSNE